MVDLIDKLILAIKELGIPAALSGGLLLIVAFATKHLVTGHLSFLKKIEVCIDKLVNLETKTNKSTRANVKISKEIQESTKKIERSANNIESSTKATEIAVTHILRNGTDK